MNISQTSVTNTTATASSATSAATQQQATQATSAIDPTTAALKKADARVQKLLDSTTASISGLGKFKAAVANTQTTAKALSALKDTSTVADVKKALDGFASSFNTVVAETKSLTADASGTARISRSMNRAVNADLSKLGDLRAMGFTNGTDGSLKIDSAKLEAAYKADPKGVQETLAKLGKLAEKTAEKELSGDGRIAGGMEKLKGQATNFMLQQSAILKVSQTFAQQNIGAATSRPSCLHTTRTIERRLALWRETGASLPGEPRRVSSFAPKHVGRYSIENVSAIAGIQHPKSQRRGPVCEVGCVAQRPSTYQVLANTL